MEELGLPIPKIHDLELLLTPLLPFHPSLRSLLPGLKLLSNYAEAIRYPGDDATKRQATAALRWAARVRTTARAILGIKASPRREKKK